MKKKKKLEEEEFIEVNGVKFSKYPQSAFRQPRKHPLEDIDNGQLATWRAKF